MFALCFSLHSSIPLSLLLPSLLSPLHISSGHHALSMLPSRLSDGRRCLLSLALLLLLFALAASTTTPAAATLPLASQPLATPLPRCVLLGAHLHSSTPPFLPLSTSLPLALRARIQACRPSRPANSRLLPPSMRAGVSDDASGSQPYPSNECLLLHSDAWLGHTEPGSIGGRADSDAAVSDQSEGEGEGWTAQLCLPLALDSLPPPSLTHRSHLSATPLRLLRALRAQSHAYSGSDLLWASLGDFDPDSLSLSAAEDGNEASEREWDVQGVATLGVNEPWMPGFDERFQSRRLLWPFDPTVAVHELDLVLLPRNLSEAPLLPLEPMHIPSLVPSVPTGVVKHGGLMQQWWSLLLLLPLLAACSIVLLRLLALARRSRALASLAQRIHPRWRVGRILARRLRGVLPSGFTVGAVWSKVRELGGIHVEFARYVLDMFDLRPERWIDALRAKASRIQSVIEQLPAIAQDLQSVTSQAALRLAHSLISWPLDAWNRAVQSAAAALDQWLLKPMESFGRMLPESVSWSWNALASLMSDVSQIVAATLLGSAPSPSPPPRLSRFARSPSPLSPVTEHGEVEEKDEFVEVGAGSPSSGSTTSRRVSEEEGRRLFLRLLEQSAIEEEEAEEEEAQRAPSRLSIASSPVHESESAAARRQRLTPSAPPSLFALSRPTGRASSEQVRPSARRGWESAAWKRFEAKRDADRVKQRQMQQPQQSDSEAEAKAGETPSSGFSSPLHMPVWSESEEKARQEEKAQLHHAKPLAFALSNKPGFMLDALQSQAQSRVQPPAATAAVTEKDSALETQRPASRQTRSSSRQSFSPT